MKIKFKVTDPLTGKKHRLTVTGDTEKTCMKVMSARLILMGVSQPKPEGIFVKIIKK